MEIFSTASGSLKRIIHGDCELWVESYDYDFDRNNSYPINEVISGRRYIRPRELENVFYIK